MLNTYGIRLRTPVAVMVVEAKEGAGSGQKAVRWVNAQTVCTAITRTSDRTSGVR